MDTQRLENSKLTRTPEISLALDRDGGSNANCCHPGRVGIGIRAQDTFPSIQIPVAVLISPSPSSKFRLFSRTSSFLELVLAR